MTGVTQMKHSKANHMGTQQVIYLFFYLSNLLSLL